MEVKEKSQDREKYYCVQKFYVHLLSTERSQKYPKDEFEKVLSELCIIQEALHSCLYTIIEHL